MAPVDCDANEMQIQGRKNGTRTLTSTIEYGNGRRSRLLYLDMHVITCRCLGHPGHTYMLNSCSTNSRGDDQLLPEDGTGWLRVILCVQHALFDPTVYHKVRAVSLENSPLLSVGVSRFLTAKRLEPGGEVMKYLIPRGVCRRSRPLIAVPYWEQGGQRADGDGSQQLP